MARGTGKIKCLAVFFQPQSQPRSHRRPSSRARFPQCPERCIDNSHGKPTISRSPQKRQIPNEIIHAYHAKRATRSGDWGLVSRTLSSRITSRGVVCGLVGVPSSSNVLGMIGGYRGLNVVVVPEIGNTGGHSVIHGVGSDCGIRSEVLKVDSALSMGNLRVTVVPEVTRILLNHRSARESGMQSHRTWRGGGPPR